MTLYAHIINESLVQLWGLTSRQRLLRVLNGAGLTQVVEDLTLVPENSSVLLIRGDHLFDERVIHFLAATPNILLKISGARPDEIVAAHVAFDLASQALEVIEGRLSGASIPGVHGKTLEDLSLSFQQRLRKFEPPFVLPITPEKRRELERRLFDWSYKGVTDLVTKWAWPGLARWAVGKCVRYGLRPNHVTLVGLLLVVLAGVLFAYGQYGWGLLAGWLMTFLDTVDGKLARVTVTSSKFGHYFDHIIDIVHPPAWYILWGIGLGGPAGGVGGLPVSAVFWLIVVFYAVGRFVEAAFTLGLGRFGIFCWQPVDSYFRLITARRNPNMLLLSAGTVCGRPDLGLLAVAFWTVLTSLFLVARLGMAVYVRIRRGPLSSWLRDTDQPSYDGSLAVRLFARRIGEQ